MKITNNREHDITITTLDNDGNPASATIPAAKRNPLTIDKLDVSAVDIDENLFKSALKKNQAVQAMIDEGWLQVDSKTAEAKK